MRRPLFVANWKMHKASGDVEAFFMTFNRRKECWRDADVILLPSFPYLHLASQWVARKPFGIGAQNMHWEEEGSYTGEVSPKQIKECGARYVLMGHSERRKYFCENDTGVNQKVHSALKFGLHPIVAIGETAEERETGKTLQVIRTQLTRDLKKIISKELQNITIAYEPVWAIGTGHNATPDQIEEVHAFIRKRVGRNPRIIYGGSMNTRNVQDIMRQKHVNGGLIGGASLDPDAFSDLIREGTRKN